MIKNRLKEYILENKKESICILIILLLGFLPITWFRGSNLIIRTDYEIPLSPSYFFKIRFYTWDEIFSRESAISLTNLFPWCTYFYIFEKLGLSLILAEKILFYLFFTIPSLGMFFLVHDLYSGKHRTEAAFISALFYIMNLYTLQFRWPNAFMSHFIYAFFPLFFYFYHKGISTGKVKYGLYMGLTSLFFTSSVSNPTYLVVVGLILFFYILLRGILEGEIKKKVKFTVVAAVIYFGIHSFWILPTLSTLTSHFSGVFTEGIGAGHTMRSFLLENRKATIINVIRMLGHWGFFGDHSGDLYFTFSKTYLKKPFLLISFLVPLLIFLSLIKKKKEILIFSTISLIGIFLLKGVNPPFGGVYLYLWNNMPLFRIFRMQFDKFGMILSFSYSILIGIGFAVILDWMKNVNKNVSYFIYFSLILVLFCVYTFPFWTGDVIRPRTDILGGSRIQIPSYYQEAGDWFREQSEDFKVLKLPWRGYTGGPSISTTWGYVGSDFIKYYIQKPMVVNRIGPLTITQPLYESFIRKSESSKVGMAWGLMNIKYILLQNDFSLITWNDLDFPDTISKALTEQEGIKLVKTFDELDIYAIENYYPLVYGTKNIILSDELNLAHLTEIDPTMKLINYTRVAKLSSHSINFDISTFNLLSIDYIDSVDFVNSLGWEYTEYRGAPEMGTYFKKNGNATISYSISIPEDSEYEIYAYLRFDGVRGTLNTYLDGVFVNSTPLLFGKIGSYDPFKHQSVNLYRGFLKKGEHIISLSNTPPIHSGGYQNLIYIAVLSQKNNIIYDSKDPVAKFQKINPTKYIVEVNDSEPFFLVLSQLYHPQWKAYYGDVNWFSAFFKKEIEPHIEVNGYSNGWYIDEPKKSIITLYFFPQGFFYVGLFISLISLFFCLVILIKKRSCRIYV